MLATISYAKDLGVVGETFMIQEEDLLEVISLKLKTLEKNNILESHKQKIQDKLRWRVMHPTPVSIPEATKQREFYYDPTFIVASDLYDHKGQIFHHKGDRINPLTIYPFKVAWLFFDATSKKQRKFARAHYKQNETKLILINGSPLKLMQQWKMPLFFDQQGFLSKKLAIKQVPAIVEQAGNRLKITEVDLTKCQG